MAEASGAVEGARARTERKARFRFVSAARKVMAVTPEMAVAWLSNNPYNRPLNGRSVEMFAEAMLRGEWKERQGVPVTVIEGGPLKNGQHRLSAVVKAGIPVRMLVHVYKKVPAPRTEGGPVPKQDGDALVQ